MTADREALARRAVAAWTELGMGWMPGMDAEDPELWEPGATAHIEATHPSRTRVKLTGYASGWSPVRSSMLPVLGCATLGCIEHGLLPEAWPGCDTSVFRSSKGTASICVYDPEFGSWVFDISGVPLGEALVACLEAAAERRRQR
jgi:hypothetical protein